MAGSCLGYNQRHWHTAGSNLRLLIVSQGCEVIALVSSVTDMGFGPRNSLTEGRWTACTSYRTTTVHSTTLQQQARRATQPRLVTGASTAESRGLSSLWHLLPGPNKDGEVLSEASLAGESELKAKPRQLGSQLKSRLKAKKPKAEIRHHFFLVEAGLTPFGAGENKPMNWQPSL